MAAALSSMIWPALSIWIYLFFFHGKFWQSGPQLPAASPPEFPDVDVVVPARDEASTIAPVIASLLAQDYAGNFRIILVDDNSGDDTAVLAGSAPKLSVLTLQSKPEDWSGKLWALSRGIAHGRAPLLLLTDADILHDPRHLSSLVAKLLQSGSEMVSEMVHLNCRSTAERLLVPAFVYFFQMLYPFNKVNDPHSRCAAAAGGTVLIRRESLQRGGGIDAIKNALIDDVALASLMKRQGSIFIGHSGLAKSIRPYAQFGDIWQMISRTAFTQLRYSAVLLVFTLTGMLVVWLLPAAALLFGHGRQFAAGLAACTLSALSYLPTLARYGRSRWWVLALPLIALFYAAATLHSALNHWLGRGARWKSRSYRGG